MPLIENPTFDQYDSILAYLSNDALRWNAQTDLGTNVIITYSFPQADDLPEGGGSYGVDDFAGFSEAQQTSFRTVLDQVEEFAGVRFVEIDSDAMIDGMIGLNGEGVSGYAYYPYMNNGISSPSDLVMVYTDFEEAGTFTYYVALHELGHSLGLEHTHEGEIPDEGDDITGNSVMTYNYNPIPSEYGTFDVAALQHLYGDNAQSADWDITVLQNGTVRTIATSGADELMGVSGKNLIFAGQGNDTLIGRESNDDLRGLGGHDTLIGGQGRDVMRGGRGNDTLLGEEGRDLMTGGDGNDSFVFTDGDDSVAGRIYDFTQGEDKIVFLDMGLSFDDLSIRASTNSDTLVINDGNTRYFLSNASDLTLTADDFSFVESGALV